MLIHVGYPKTGSTWLQKSLFIPKNGFRQIMGWGDSFRLLVHPNELLYSPESVEEAIDVPPGAINSYVPVLSQELLVGHELAGGVRSVDIARRLHSKWPDARILMVIREQKSIILSMYSQYVRHRGPLTLGRYLDPPQKYSRPVFDLRYLEYHRLIELYRDLFGSSKVKVITFESLSSSPHNFSDEIANFVGQDNVDVENTERKNSSLDYLEVVLRGYLNRLFAKDDYHNNVAFMRLPKYRSFIGLLNSIAPSSFEDKAKQHLNEIINKRVGVYFENSNSRTVSLTGLSLEEQGYPC